MYYFLTVNYFSIGLIEKLLQSLHNQSWDFLLVVVNNSPDDPDLILLEDPQVLILEACANIGFGAACNLGLDWIWQRSVSATVWLINPDATLPAGTIDKLDRLLINYPEIAIVGTNIYQEDGSCTFAGGSFNPFLGEIKEVCTIGTAYLAETNWVSGCSIILQLTKFCHCPAFNPVYFLYYEDFAFCQHYRQHGYKIYICHDLSVIHQTSAITSRDPDRKTRQEITSYLLALWHYAPFFAIIARLLRIMIGASIQILSGNLQPRAKLSGIWQFIKILAKYHRW